MYINITELVSPLRPNIPVRQKRHVSLSWWQQFNYASIFSNSILVEIPFLCIIFTNSYYFMWQFI